MVDELPPAISCCRDRTNSRNFNAYMACFALDAEMIDVSRDFTGRDAISVWVLIEVISSGDTFACRIIWSSPKVMPRWSQLAGLVAH